MGAIFIDPWKDIDLEQPFDLPESIFDIKDCFVSIKDKVVRKPDDNKMSFLSMGTKIKRIYMKNIEDQEADKNLYKLIIQYDDSIHVS